MSGLHSTQLGETGPWVVFCHGLFGQGRNWTAPGKALAAAGHRALLLDLPDHGRSPWTSRFDYVDAADQVARTLSSLGEPAALVGHSMGGKVAMLVALRHPALVERLCVVDVAPVGYRDTGGFDGYVRAMQALDLDTLERRAQADEALREAVPDPAVRGFLLQNLRHEHGRWRWQPHLEVLGEGLTALRGWPEDELSGDAPYPGRVLWVAGADSFYVRDEMVPAMTAWFPRVRRVTVKGAGHWVHSDQPAVFLEILTRFLDR